MFFASSARLLCLASIGVLTACSNPIQNQSLIAGTLITSLGHTPTTNIGQTYYLGVFDPREQLPPTIYRIRVKGQASALSSTNFASGWVRADLLDSLSGKVELDKNQITLTNNEGKEVNIVNDVNGLNRRLIMFGPEGFREAPKDHRLVIVMGSSPDSFFNSVDRALGVVASVTQPSNNSKDVNKLVSGELSRMREEKRAIQTLLDLAGKE